MNAAEFTAEIDAHGFTDATLADKIALLNDAIWDIDSREQWPYLDTSGDLTFAAASSTATSFPAQWSKTLSLINTTSGVVLQPMEYDIIRKHFASGLTDQGEPLYYYFIGSQLNVYPVPGASTVLKMAYTRWQTELTTTFAETDVLMPIRHHRVATLRVLQHMAAREDDLDMATYFQSQFEDRFARMVYDVFMQQFDRPGRVYLDDDDYGEY